MEMNSLDDLFHDQLKDIYSAERQLIKALPKMAKAASSPELKTAFQEHLEETKGHAERLEQIFEELGVSAGRKKCKGMEGLIEEGKEILEQEAKPAVSDAGLIAAAQRVEHYEIAAYGTARTFAKMLGLNSAERLLEQTLKEEEATDKKLTQMTEGDINLRALEGEEDEEDEE